MAAGDITNARHITCGHPGGKTNLELVTVNAEFGDPGTGKITITAAELGLDFIIGFSAGVWGVATGVGQFVYSTTAYVATGVTSINLELITDASTLIDDTVSLIFWGN